MKKVWSNPEQIKSKDVRDIIDEYLNSFKEKDVYKEVAFFGGSFTGIDVELQESLLSAAYDYIKEGKIDGIRISTRPDYIDKPTLKRLKKYKVKTIELGVQSSNDYVLRKSKRGHTFEDVKKASKMIRWHGFTLGHQMMLGMPESSELDDINTAKDLIKLKPKIVRIYPVLVIKGTELERDYNEGKYEPLTVDRAVERCKEICYLFEKKKIKIIRIGLQTTDGICNPESPTSEVVAGPYHENFRGLVEASIYYDSMIEKIKNFNMKVKEVEIVVNPQNVSNIVGHKRENIIKLKETYDIDVKIVQDIKCPLEKIDIRVSKEYKDFKED